MKLESKKNNQSTLSDFGVGLLGVSGKYFAKSNDEINDLISLIIRNYDSFIDTATVYGSEKNHINTILSKCLFTSASKTSCYIINKYGLDLDKNVNNSYSLINDFHQSYEFFPSNQIMHLIHRASLDTLERDYEFYNYIKRYDSSLVFGICTNNLEVLKCYLKKMNINILQVAINLLDYTAVIPLITFAKANDIFVLARSVLASGVLSLKYNQSSCDLFQDSIRKRFSISVENKKIYSERIKNRDKIHEFFLDKNLDQYFSFEQFCYSILFHSPLIDAVILGGTSLSQLTDNSHIRSEKITKEIVDQVFASKVFEWASCFI